MSKSSCKPNFKLQVVSEALHSDRADADIAQVCDEGIADTDSDHGINKPPPYGYASVYAASSDTQVHKLTPRLAQVKETVCDVSGRVLAKGLAGKGKSDALPMIGSVNHAFFDAL